MKEPALPKNEQIRTTQPENSLEQTVSRIASSLEKGEDSDALQILSNVGSRREVILKDGKIQKAAKQRMIELLANGNLDKAIKIKDALKLSDDFIKSNEVQDAATRAMIKDVSRGHIDEAIDIQSAFNIPKKEARRVAAKAMIERISNSDVGTATKVRNEFELPEEVALSTEAQKAAMKGLVASLAVGAIDVVEKISYEFELPDPDIMALSTDVQEAAIAGFAASLLKGDTDTAYQIEYKFNIPEETMRAVAVGVMIETLLDKRIDIVYEIEEEFNLPEEYISNRLSSHIVSMTSAMKIPESNKLKTFFTKYVLGEQWLYIPQLTVAENVQLKKSIYLEEGYKGTLLESEIIFAPESDEEYKDIFEKISSDETGLWNSNDDHNIRNTFIDGAEYFGSYEKMFKYVGIDRHDRLFTFNNIVSLAKQSGLLPELFYANILHQVSKDGGFYGSHNAYQVAIDFDTYDERIEYNDLSIYDDHDACQELNNISMLLQGVDIQQKIEEAKQYDGIDYLQDFLASIGSISDVYTSWKFLRKFADIVSLLNRKQILASLQTLDKDGKPKLKKYIESLTFHPNINTSSVLQFWQDPEGFLNIGDTDSRKTHELKKPSNYTNIPYMDITGEDLRDALIEGSLDKVHEWSPLEVIYTIPTGEYAEKSFVDILKSALGSKRDGVQGEAKKPGVLFKELNTYTESRSIDLMNVLNGGHSLSENERDEISEILHNSEFGINIPTDEYRVKIGLKSDPDVVVAGNDTACCMPFGSGKNNVYMYNPICGQLVVQKKIGEDSWRTVAQSVITKDKDIGRNVADIVAKIQKQDTSVFEMFDDNILESTPDIMTCDNIEVSPNFKDVSVLKKLYTDFFLEYANRFGKEEDLDTNRVIIGTGHTDATFGQRVENTFVPTAPVGYSDNIGRTALELSLTKPTGVILKKQSNAQYVERRPASVVEHGVSDLNATDTLAVSYLEGKAYSDNESFKEYLHNLENGLIAKDIYNAHKNRPNMSFKYADADGKTQAYMMAYEGKYEGGDILYIADLAANPESKMAGGRLITAFINAYKRNYIDKGSLMPILTRARDKTSYRIITKQLGRQASKIGMSFKLQELRSDSAGEDTMHKVMIIPQRTE